MRVSKYFQMCRFPCVSFILCNQEEGLKVAYNNPEDRTVKEYTHILAALAFVPISDVETYFATLKTMAPVE